MRVKIRAKYGAAPVVLDEHDNPVEGVKSISYSWSGLVDGKAVATLVLEATVVMEVEATVITPPKPSASVVYPKSKTV